VDLALFSTAVYLSHTGFFLFSVFFFFFSVCEERGKDCMIGPETFKAEMQLEKSWDGGSFCIFVTYKEN